ncbi:MAG: adenosine kinase [Chitinispirillales bacterium]|jgi:sugar/nucleoside kinase (ribokinase family)|nr:adenosine kinase [Chitinispirillales bacterium]
MTAPFKVDPAKSRVTAIGSALMDLCLMEEDAFLSESGAQKGGMVMVDHTHITSLLSKSVSRPSIVPGGSACNTIVGVGRLGAPARFIGKRGNDELGKTFEKSLVASNVDPILFTSPSATGHVLSIITPDAQRSMLTYLGASAETKPHEIINEHFADSAFVHLEGYLLFNPQLIKAALKAAKAAGAFISLDLASFTVVESSLELLEEIVHEYVDIVIANEDEAASFTGHKDEEKAAEALAKKAAVGVMKLGKRGSIITHGNNSMRVAPRGSGKAVDTTGAGDLWASGFLYGLVKGYDIETSGKIASLCGYEVCQVVGAHIPDDGWNRIKTEFGID